MEKEDKSSVVMSESDDSGISTSTDIILELEETHKPIKKPLPKMTKELHDGKEIATLKEIPVHGVNPSAFNSKGYVKSKQCSLCARVFGDEMVTENVETGENNCYHCIYWLNYDVSRRPFVDGLYNLSIVDYIIKCRDSHKIDMCKSTGQCVVCDYLQDLPIKGVCGVERLLPDNENGDDEVNYDEDDDGPMMIQI